MHLQLRTKAISVWNIPLSPSVIQSQGKLIKIYLEASRSRYLNRSHCSMGQWELGHPALVQLRAAPVWSAVFTGGHGGIGCSPQFCQLQQLQDGGRPGSPGSALAAAVPSEFPFNGSDILMDCQGASGCGLHAGAQQRSHLATHECWSELFQESMEVLLGALHTFEVGRICGRRIGALQSRGPGIYAAGPHWYAKAAKAHGTLATQAQKRRCFILYP